MLLTDLVKHYGYVEMKYIVHIWQDTTAFMNYFDHYELPTSKYHMNWTRIYSTAVHS